MIANGGDDIARDIALVERIRAALDECAQGSRDLRVGETCAGRLRGAVGVEVERARGGVTIEIRDKTQQPLYPRCQRIAVLG